MTNTQCFKIKPDTNFDKAIKKHFTLLFKWEDVYAKVSELLGEKITQLGFSTEELYVDTQEITKEENKKLFKKDGSLKGNSKGAKLILNEYKKIINEAGLSEYQELRMINFMYGVMRRQGQSLESYRTSENDIYYKADFDLAEKTNGLVIPITEVEYQEKYLEEIKKKESN
jgi:hypothetical protein